MSPPETPPDTLDYVLLRRRRKTISVSVSDDGEVEVRAPLRAPQRAIEEVLSLHFDWLVEQKRASEERLARARARRFEDGEAVPYMGRTLRLRLEEPVLGGRAARLDGDELVLTPPAGVSEADRRGALREAVGRFLVERAADVFHERHVAMAKLVGVSAVRLTIKDMRSRWGSCGPKRRMSLNWRLILAPLEVIDYVIAHELTHIRHPDHSRRFWADLSRSLPGWRPARDWLKRHGDDLRF